MRHASLLLCLALIGCTSAPPSTTAPKAVQANLDDPWPECKQVREYFAENLGEPGSFEVVKWEGRGPWGYATSKDDPTIQINVKYRAKNKYGAMELRRGWAIFHKDTPLEVTSQVVDF